MGNRHRPGVAGRDWLEKNIDKCIIAPESDLRYVFVQRINTKRYPLSWGSVIHGQAGGVVKEKNPTGKAGPKGPWKHRNYE